MLPRRRMAGESVLGAAGLRLGWGLAVEDARGTCSPPEVRVGSGEVRSAEFIGHGGSGRRDLVGAGGSMTPGGYGYQNLARKDRADRDVAHRGRGTVGFAAQGVDGVKRRRGRLGASRKWTSRCAPASWCPRMGS